MKTITVNVSEPVYRAFREHAQRHDRKTAELIREAMEAYRVKVIEPRTSLRQLIPLSLGTVGKTVGHHDDLLEEMTGDPRD